MELVELVLADPDPRVCASLVQHPNPDVQRRLVEVLGARELRQLARKATDMSTLMALAGIPDQGIVTDLASRLSGLQYEEALLDAILDNPAYDDWACKYLTPYWYLSERIFERIATEGGQRTLYGLALNEHASARSLEIVYERADPESSDGSKALEALAGNDSTPFPVLSRLATSGFATAEATLARHPDLSTDELLRLGTSWSTLLTGSDALSARTVAGT